MLIGETPQGYRIRVTLRVAEALHSHRIRRVGRGVAWPAEEHVESIVPRNMRIEPYCAYVVQGHFATMGAFSYTRSKLPADILIGRYCSIGANLSVLAE